MVISMSQQCALLGLSGEGSGWGGGGGVLREGRVSRKAGQVENPLI